MTTAHTTATVQPTTIAELDLAPIDAILERSIVLETKGEELTIAEITGHAREIDGALATIIPTLGYGRVREWPLAARDDLQKIIAPHDFPISLVLLTVLMARSELKQLVQSIKG